MLTRPIPSTNEALPILGCGTYGGFDVKPGPDSKPLQGVLRALFEAGGSVLDSSPMYGAAEGNIGDLLDATATRAKAFVATKVWTRGRAPGVAQMERSLDLLRTKYVDLMQVHNLLDWRTHLDTLAGWKAEGRTRYVGVTHYQAGGHAELAEVMASAPIDFVQLNYSLHDRSAEARLLPLAQERGIAVLANLPFGGSVRDQGPLPDFAESLGCTTHSQLQLKFVLGHPAVTCVIPGTGNPAHMIENAKAAEGDLEHARDRIHAWTRSRG